MNNEEKHALNRLLYRRIRATFKHVQIRNRGEKQIRKMTTDLVSGKPKVDISHKGEYYVVCCPCCNDTKFRCYINHVYGKDDELGRPQTHLVHCFNVGCPLESGESTAFEEVKEMLTGYNVVDLRTATVTPGKEVDVDAIRATWPGDVTRVDKLPAGHNAVVYLETRGFPVARLGRFYNVHFCNKSDRFFYEGNIVIPIYHRKKMVGWQLRPPYECDWKKSRVPKYYTAPGTPKKHILYNLGNAQNYQVGVIMEGVTDVWGLGPQGVCTLGAKMAASQFKLFERKFKEYAGVLLLDADLSQKEPATYAKLAEAANELSPKLKHGFCSVTLPHGDPGSLDRRFLRSFISEEAAKQNVTINWNRR
jgi:hypothetical protein|tara:strand:+ start:1239 stop:2327 length:1089 start_codon:yes stop_codon:yes gene_type:complete